MRKGTPDGAERRVAPTYKIHGLIEAVIEDGGEFRLITAGTSMKPLLRDRQDTVVLVKPDAALKKYDLPLYRRENGQFVLHRVVRCNADGTYATRGDNQTETEQGVADRQVLAVVSRIVRGKHEINLRTSKLYRLYVLLWCPTFSVGFFYRRLRAAAAKGIHTLISHR